MFLNRKATFWAVGIGHLTVDMFNGMGPVLLAFLSAHILSLSNTQIGIAVSAYSLAGAISQPLFGWLGDKTGGRWLSAGGVAWTVCLMMLSMAIAQITGMYWMMLIPYVLASFGSGAFHPVGAMHAADSDKVRAATNTSLFFLMGQLGLGIGPALAGFLLDRVATHNMLFTKPLGPAFSRTVIESGTMLPVIMLALVAIPGVILMAFALPGKHAHHEIRNAENRADETIRVQRTKVPVRAFVLLGIVVALRSLINPGIVAFIPSLFEQKGWDATQYGLITSMFWIGGGIAGVVVGRMAERFDSRMLVAATLLLSAPAIFFLPLLDGMAAMIVALVGGALSGSSHSLLVVQAQGMIPGSKGFASGAIMGYMFTTGAIGSLIIGSVSDSVGLTVAFQAIGVVTVITGLLGLVLPPDGRLISARKPEVESRTVEAAA